MLRDWKLHKNYQQELKLRLLLYQSIEKRLSNHYIMRFSKFIVSFPKIIYILLEISIFNLT
ncbi:hypothetical protein [Clostridium sp. Cult2]|uniref:hypothetical protein n=1 Tax=Clostridium sp. Cult2 TaxID=2079003 RepID=UPI001F48C5B3|nr:hypothetical protein [Clostridium sp. Cult2]MCF6465593.1 hypothetical protein [Clostridium sp. Cult2]